MLNSTTVKFRQMATTAANDALAGGVTFENYEPDPGRIYGCEQSAGVAVALIATGAVTVVPMWYVETIDGHLGWFRDEPQKIVLAGAARQIVTLQVRAQRLIFWVEGLAAASNVRVFAAKARAV